MPPPLRKGAAMLPSGAQVSSVADRIEKGVPGIWKGIRTLFNFKNEAPQEIISAVPAAMQTVVCNQNFDVPEVPVMHPTLGVQGIRLQGSQFLCGLQQPTPGTIVPGYTGDNQPITGAFNFPSQAIYADSSLGQTGVASIGINPWTMGGRIAFKSFNYQRYRYNSVRLRLVSTTNVSAVGSLAIGYYKDYANGSVAMNRSSVDFRRVADLVPSIATPNNIAQAEITMNYQGNELYYLGTDNTNGRPLQNTDPASITWGDAQNRQEQQGIFVVASDSTSTLPTPIPLFNVYFEYDIELYDPRPEDEGVPSTSVETALVRDVLRFVREKPLVIVPPRVIGGHLHEKELAATLDRLMIAMQSTPARAPSVLSSAAASPALPVTSDPPLSQMRVCDFLDKFKVQLGGPSEETKEQG